MKKITLSMALITICLILSAQTPQAFKYQAVARGLDGNPIINQGISVQISILAESTSGDVVFSEEHSVSTNSMGLFNLEIGSNIGLFGLINIDWGVSDYFLKVEIDETGGSNYQLMGTSQLLSVPYALYAENTAHPEDADADPTNEIQTITETDYEVTLSDGGGTFMTGLRTYTQAEIDAMMPYNGLTVVNSTTNCLNYYNNNKWFKTCGECTPLPTVANAGNDAIVEGGNFSLYLSANTPEFGNGLWSVLSGEGGIFADATNPTTLFTGLPYNIYTLQWAISTPCSTTNDEVTITIYATPCGSPFTDTRNGKIYETVQLGDQCWMAENLNYGTRINGTISQTNNGIIEKYCYSNLDYFCTLDGGLYQWNEMMNYSTTPGVKGICPTGWHLPHDLEWTAMWEYVTSQTTFLCIGNEYYYGKSLASTVFWDASSVTCAVGNNLAANNATGFNGFPSGRRFEGSFIERNTNSYWWSSSMFSPTTARFWYMEYDNEYLNAYYHNRVDGYSVRCLRD